MSLQTTTLRKSITCAGVGLHSGQRVSIALHPAEAGSGIVFHRTDLKGKSAYVPARYDLVSATRLGTTLTNGHDVSVATVEHVMAALWGMGVDNAVVEIDGPEVPIMDGSSEPFVEMIEAAGVRTLSAPRKLIRVIKTVEVMQGESSAAVSPYEGEAEGCSLDIEIDFNHPLIPRSRARYDFSQQQFKDALANARTFGFAHEVAALRAQGLARGGSLENAIVLGEDTILNEEGLRSPDEFIRHKALDCMGDLFLAGLRIEGAFRFVRPGHCINNALLRALLADASAWTLVTTDRPQARRVAGEPVAAYL